LKRKRLLIGGAAVLLILALAAGLLVAYRMHQARNIKGSSTVEFTTTTAPVKPVPPKPEGVVWPMWGYDPQHLRAPAGIDLRPPYRRIWEFRAHELLEFPPVIAYGKLYLNSYDGRFYALDEKTGKQLWHYDSGRCGASSGAVAHGLVYATFIGLPPCDNLQPQDGGLIVALNAKTGKLVWRAPEGPDETSPLLAKGLLYVGDWDGNVSAFDPKTGTLRWRFRTGGPVKGSIALSGPNVIAGSYDGHVYALNARTGQEVWRGSAQPRFASLSLGTFYSTPAVAYGRVYIGNTDGKVYSFGAKTGELRWSHSTGGYVYSSPGVWHEKVYAGSYDGTFFALDAATGEPVWTFKAAGPISGAPTIINGIVYFACFRSRTYALDATTGKEIWSFPDGHYSPVVADTRRLYLVGYGRLYGMVERHAHRKR
jgi:outer membrane protein assembly factor BamB